MTFLSTYDNHQILSIPQISLCSLEIGRTILRDDQKEKVRAEYAKETLKNIGNDLNKEFGKGYSVDNLQWMRKFILLISNMSQWFVF